MKPVVYCITATKDRHRQLERVVRFFLNQTYDGKLVQLIYNNSLSSLRLDPILPPNKFLLVNNHVSLKGGNYTNLGDIYNDILTFLPAEAEVVTFMDDDDIYLPHHVDEGVNGLQRGGLTAYKPLQSIFRTRKKSQLAENVLEPSIFVKAEHIRKYGFSPETTAQHLQWVRPLWEQKQIFADPKGKPTYICDWSQDISTYKTSGNPRHPENFNHYTLHSTDKGDGIITPASQTWAKRYYRYAKVE